ncbi:S41 family peptidase [Pedobacter agri]|uniref:S41 family peptidase n=1 Tax=Pedobacter agri TaxID=454586 RepID=A0A9X3I929_9SPHI|nr:S41 family peptidase [Pedobacter agri]MCX3264569.1 S41 family peptidase [Pedobacter agri]
MKSLFTLCFVLVSITGFTQTSQQIRNLTAFSKLYGYVQYFHPSDEASRIEWQGFAIYGSQKMLQVKDDQELITTLNELFLPVAPTLKLSSKADLKFDLSEITPQNLTGYKSIYWQHVGLKLPYFDTNYNSIRINRINPITQKKITENAFALAPVNVATYKGKKFILNIHAESDIKNLVLKPYLDKLVFIKASAVSNKEKEYFFEGVFDPQLELFAIAIEPNFSTGSLNVNKISLKIIDEGKTLDIPLVENTVALNQLDSKIDIRIVRFFRPEGDQKLFDKELKIGEFIAKPLVPGIKFMMPLALYGNEKHTFPIVNETNVTELINRAYASWPKDEQGEFKIRGADITIRLADVVILYNALKHSYPYWDDATINADELWNKSILRVFSDKTDLDFLKTLKWIANSLNDGHMFVDLHGDTDKDIATLPMLFDIAEGKVVIKKVLDSGLVQKVKAGDELTKINQKNPFDILRSTDSLFSGSKQWKQAKSLIALTKGKKNEVLHLNLNRRGQNLSVDVARTFPYSEYVSGSDRNNRGACEWISSDIFYINLNKTTTEAHMAEILKAKSVIVDMRGYLNENTETFLSHLTHQKLTASSGMFTPQILYPDYKNVSYTIGSYTIEPVLPYVKAKIFLLSDATGQSATESFLSAYKQFKVVTIVGQPTSGTNGGINLVSMPGGYRFFYSGMLVKNPDGSKHHLNGVIPDVTVNSTIKGIQECKDEILEEAIRLATEDK